jgi:carbonic anhydrase/acetyltransferase-like protein (isoleucine patch superfamily)
MSGAISSRVVSAVSSAARKLGAALDNAGASLEVAQFTEKLVPSTRFVAVDNVAPTILDSASFVAPSASVIGDVTLGKNSSIWYGATVRADVNKVTIGENTSIGDRAVVHVAKIQGNFMTSIGNNVTVEPGALIHAATVKDSCVVGASAQVMDGSVVETHSIIAPGSVVTPGTKVASGELWAGSPAKKVRALTADEIATIAETAMEKVEMASRHNVECSKDYKQLAEDMEQYEDDLVRDEDYWQQEAPDHGDVLGQGSPGRIFNSTLTHPEEGLKMKNKQ